MEHLIESVRKYPCLWQLDSPQYKDNELKEAAWQEVFNECDFPSVAEMKSLWKKLRDGHRQAINAKKKITTGQAATSKSKWKYEQQMEFLLPFMKNRITHTNIIKTQQHEDSLTGEDSQDTPSESKIKRNKTTYSILEDEQRRREKRQEERNILRKQIIENSSRNENKNTAMENFFMSMCDTSSQLPEYVQMKIQRQIFNIVMEAKEQHLIRLNSTQGSSGFITYNFTGGSPFQLQRTGPYNSSFYASPAENYNNPDTIQSPPPRPKATHYARFSTTPVQNISRPNSANSLYTSPDPTYSPETLQSPPPPQSSNYVDCSQNAGSTTRQHSDAPVQHYSRSHSANSSYTSPGPVNSPEIVKSPPSPPQSSNYR